jgi:hypothetical protein
MTEEHEAPPPAASKVEEAIGSEAEPEPGRYRGTRRTPPTRSKVFTGLGHVREPRSWLGRTVGLLLGTLVLAVAFITAYVVALHEPTPRDVPVAVVRDDTAALGVAVGTVPRNLERAGLRIVALVVFSALVGTAGAVVAGPVTDVWTSRFVGLALAGALVTFTAAMLTSAAQGWLGLLGTGLAVLLLVALGNPGSGGIYPPEFLPAFFDQMYRWNIPGLGVNLVEGVAYFDRQAIGWPVTALAIWALAGVVGLLLATAVFGRRAQRLPVPSSVDQGQMDVV